MRSTFDPATDYYGMLGIPASAREGEIRAAYRRLAKVHHPDLHAESSRAAARMARLNVAKSVLLDPAARSAYDAARRLRFGGSAAGQAPANGTAPVRGGGTATVVPVRRRHAAESVEAAGQDRTPTDSRRARTHGRLDGTSLLLLGLAAPAVMALALYLYGGVQAAGQPRTPMVFDLGLSASTRQPDAQGTAQLVFALVGGKPPDERTARYAFSVTQNLRDSSPEASELRALGRTLVDAARRGDEPAWSSAVGRLCLLAGHC